MNSAKKENVWKVSLQVTSPERPALKHQLTYTVRAEDKEQAERNARESAAKDGNTVVSHVGTEFFLRW